MKGFSSHCVLIIHIKCGHFKSFLLVNDCLQQNSLNLAHGITLIQPSYDLLNKRELTLVQICWPKS